MAKMNPVGYAEVVDPNKFITFSDMLRAAASTAGPTRRGPASSWDVPQAMSEPVIGQRPNPRAPISLQDMLSSRPVETDPTQLRNAREPQPGIGFGPPEATNMRANINQSGPIGALQSLISNLTAPRLPAGNGIVSNADVGGMYTPPRLPAGNGIVPNADVSGTYTPPDPTNLDISGPGFLSWLGEQAGYFADERTPRRPETLPIYSSAAPAARQNTAPLPAREDRARGEPYVTAPQGKAAAGSPISIVRALQNTNYLPVMDAQGRVSYQSEGAIQDRAARAAAAEAAKAKMDLDRSTAIKNVKKSPVEQAQEFQYGLAMEFDRAARSLPQDNPDRQKFEKRRDDIIQSLMVKMSGSPAENAIADMIENFSRRQNQGAGIQG